MKFSEIEQKIKIHSSFLPIDFLLHQYFIESYICVDKKRWHVLVRNKRNEACGSKCFMYWQAWVLLQGVHGISLKFHFSWFPYQIICFISSSLGTWTCTLAKCAQNAYSIFQISPYNGKGMRIKKKLSIIVPKLIKIFDEKKMLFWWTIFLWTNFLIISYEGSI
jgi:hypothetical protein